MSPERVKLDRAPRSARISAAPDYQTLLDARVAALVKAARDGARATASDERTQHAVAALGRAVEDLERAREAASEEVGRTAVGLALEIARRILRRELPERSYDIELIVRETLARARLGRGACVVHLHPDDVAALADKSFRANTRIEPDPELALGEVHVETPQGLLVRDVEEILVQIEESLLESFSE